MDDLGNMGRNEAAQIHVHLYHQPINESIMLDVDIGSVRGRSKVEVAKEAPSLGEGGEVFSQNLPRSPSMFGVNCLPSIHSLAAMAWWSG